MAKKSKHIIAFLLAVVLTLSVFPSLASAEELTEGTVGDSNVSWHLDADTGRLTISGSGDCEDFTSEADQPWAGVRDKITSVWFDGVGNLSISSLAYWFTGCTNLTMAEVPYTTLEIGEGAFSDCPNLTDIMFYYIDEDDFKITPGAFYVSEHTETTVWVIAEEPLATVKTAIYGWEQDNRHVELKDVYGQIPIADCAIGGCTCSSCYFYYDYISVDASSHEEWVLCSGCGVGQGLGTMSHTFSGTTCTACGYVGAASCSHYYTYKTWSGCTWYEYCSSCDMYLNSGTSHGSYAYGTWSYYSSSQHRTRYYCTSCGSGSYVYDYHSTTDQYSSYSDTQHKVTKYCATCSTTIGSASYASHADTNSDGACDSCGYEMSRFSVTLPTAMKLAVSENGEVTSVGNIAIVNNSTGTVEVTGITVKSSGRWTIVPFSHNMAASKVDASLIGFSVNGAKTTKTGTSESLTLSGDWSISKGSSLPLTYDAVVSASSESIIDEQVLTLTFVVDWAA